MAKTVLFFTGTGSWIVPPGVTSLTVRGIGGGADGRDALGTSSPSWGGAGGGYAESTITVTPGSTIYYQAGIATNPSDNAGGGLTHSTTWVNKAANTQPSATTDGIVAIGSYNTNYQTNNAPTFGCLGTTVFFGGNGSLAYSGLPGGGGGAGGPSGAGVSTTTWNGGAGDGGSGGAGGQAFGSYTGTYPGSDGQEWTQTSDGAKAGSGGGGGGSAGGPGGHGGKYGGGGSGVTATPGTPAGAGGPGIVVLEYTPPFLGVTQANQTLAANGIIATPPLIWGDCGTLITKSNGYLDAITNNTGAGQWVSVRGNTAYTSGLWYFEIEVLGGPPSYITFGLCDNTTANGADLDNPGGPPNQSIGKRADGIISGGSFSDTPPTNPGTPLGTLAIGSRIGLAVNFNTQELYMSHNGSWTGDPETRTSPDITWHSSAGIALYPWAWLYGGDPDGSGNYIYNKVRIHGNTESQKYPAPTGYTEWGIQRQPSWGDCGDYITLSNSKLDATNNSDAVRASVRSNTAKTAGHWYCEIEALTSLPSTAYMFFGICDDETPPDQLNDPEPDWQASIGPLACAGVRSDGSAVSNPDGNFGSGGFDSSFTINAGDRIGIAVDCEYRVAAISINGSWPTAWGGYPTDPNDPANRDNFPIYWGQGALNVNLRPSVYVWASLYATLSDGPAAVRIHPDAASLLYTVPTGYQPWEAKDPDTIYLNGANNLVTSFTLAQAMTLPFGGADFGMVFALATDTIFNKVGIYVSELAYPDTRLVHLYNFDTQEFLQEWTVDTNGAAVGTFAYAIIPPLGLSANTHYALGVQPSIGSDPQLWYGPTTLNALPDDTWASYYRSDLGFVQGIGRSQYYGLDLDYDDTIIPPDATADLSVTQDDQALNTIAWGDSGTVISFSDHSTVATNSTTGTRSTVRFSIPQSEGRWYNEIEILTPSPNNDLTVVGVCDDTTPDGPELDVAAPLLSGGIQAVDGNAVSNGFVAYATSGFTPTTGDIIGIAFDADAREAYIALNNVWFNGSDPSANSNPIVTWYDNGPTNIYPFVSLASSSSSSVKIDPSTQTFAAPTGFKSNNGKGGKNGPVVSGTLTVTETADTFAATGTVPLGNNATLAVTQANQAISAAGTVLFPSVSGTLAVVQISQSVVATGTVVVSGTLTATQQNQSLSAIGKLAISGTLSATQANHTLAASVSLVITGTLSVNQTNNTLTATMSVIAHGTLTANQSPQILSAAGKVPFLVTGIGTASGTSSATAKGVAAFRAVAVATGQSSATGVAALITAGSGIANAHGVAVVTGVGASQAKARATASGSSAASYHGAMLKIALALASGSSTAVGVGKATVGKASVATASGSSTALAIGDFALVPHIGVAHGTSTALAIAQVVTNSIGHAIGSSTAKAFSAGLVTAVGTAEGTSRAIGWSISGATGLADGSSTAIAVGRYWLDAAMTDLLVEARRGIRVDGRDNFIPVTSRTTILAE